MSAINTDIEPVMADLALWRDLYEMMAQIREFESTAGRLMAAGKLPGFIHLLLGQEAIAAGVCGALRRTDLITTTHRGHGHCLAKGATAFGMMAELFGRSAGYCGGRSGSMHMADPELGILGANAIVGAGLPIALGGALATAAAGNGDLAVAFFGEGAVAEGVFHETLNLAALWKLPLIMVCENNQYAEMSHVSMHLANTDVASYARNYAVPGDTFDGNDVLAVYSATRTAIARARNGDGPSLLEFSTYRWHGHYEGDPQHYRDRAEVAQWKSKDPLLVFRDHWKAAGSDSARLDQIDEGARALIAEAVIAAESSPRSAGTQLLDHVYTPMTSAVDGQRNGQH